MQGRGRALQPAAAREMFSERGYNGSFTREIADRVGVSEPMLFRHFGNQANLFEADAPSAGHDRPESGVLLRQPIGDDLDLDAAVR